RRLAAAPTRDARQDRGGSGQILFRAALRRGHRDRSRRTGAVARVEGHQGRLAGRPDAPARGRDQPLHSAADRGRAEGGAGVLAGASGGVSYAPRRVAVTRLELDEKRNRFGPTIEGRVDGGAAGPYVS